jgi:photosystem II stability/assembly factor-like uncharacterized protein
MGKYFEATAALCLTLLTTWAQAQVKNVAGTYAVFRSQDRGRTWSRSDAGLRATARINAFGAIGSAVLAGTDEGVYLSHNRGVDWKVASGAAVGSGRILSLATLGANAYAGSDRSGVLVSADGGTTWVVNADCPFRYVRSILSHEGALYAGTDAQGVFVSRNGGRSWSSINSGLPAGAQVFSMAELKGRVFAALYSKGLYVWAGQEQRWHKVDGVSPLVLAAIGETLLAGHNPGGMRHSDDFGGTWARGEIDISEDLGNAPVWELGSGPGFAIAGISSGIYYSEDRGRTWVRARTGLPAKSSGIAFLAAPDFVLAGASIGRKN